MFSSKPKAFTLTFVFYITLALTLVAVSNATGPNINRRDHVNLTRLIKKRAPLPQGSGDNLGLVGVAPDPASKQSASTTSTDTLSTPSPSPETTPTTSQTTTSTPLIPALSTSTSTTTSTTSTSTSSTLAPSTSVNVTSSATSTTTSASSSTTPAAQTSQTSQTINVVGVSASPVTTTPDNTQTITQTATGKAQSTAPANAATAASTSTTTKRTTITVLIVIASSIAGVAVIWTIIRKWKFRPSSQFEDRMQPIDWQPTSSHEDGGSSAHRRLSNASSFHSGSGHFDNSAGRGVGYGATSDGLNPLPDHDFTPGVSTLAPVGGYADLARGPSPQQPQMQETLRRGPSANRPNFGVPIHHQAGYSAQDPYGGVY